MAGRLAGKVAVITGTGSGQGRAGALRFAAEGARVAGCDLDVASAEETVRMVRDAGGEMVSLAPCDIAEEDAVVELMRFAVESFGDFDILWNNAGTQRPGTVERQPVEHFNYTLTHELTTLFMAVKHALPVFKRRGGGAVINTASISATTGSGWVGNIAGMLSHSIGKAGVVRMTEVMAVELSPWNVRVNAISPGIIETNASKRIIGTEDAPGPLREPFLESLLLRRIGVPDDVVNAALFLASDEAAYVTGVNLPVDGGYAASGGVGQARADVTERLRVALEAAGLSI
jgi:meso-butanediol dehydrogenase / (S,S)-butanediol dehydrogenase / diacetyl reductase